MESLDEHPTLSKEFNEILRQNITIILALDAAMKERQNISLVQKPLSEHLHETFLQDHDKLIEQLRQIKERTALIDVLMPYAPIINRLATLEGYRYVQTPGEALSLQQEEFEIFRQLTIDLLDAIMQTPVADTIWKGAAAENRQYSRTPKRHAKNPDRLS